MNGRRASVKHRTDSNKVVGLPGPMNPVRHRTGRSNGGEGLEKARAKGRKKKMKELAASPLAYTVKVKLPFNGSEVPEEVIGHINDAACRLRFIKHYDRRGTGLMVRAELTDAREVWARVVPAGTMNQPPPHPLWGGLYREKS